VIRRAAEAPSARVRADRPRSMGGIGSIIIVGVGAGVVSAIVALSQLVILAPLVALGILLVLPSLATAAFVFLLYSNAPAIATNFHALPYALAAGVIGLLLIPIFREIVHRRPLTVNPAVGLIAAFVLVSLVSTLQAADFDVALTATLLHVTDGVIVVLLITNAIRSRGDLRYAVGALLLAAIATSGLAVYQALTSSYDQIYGGFAQLSAGAINEAGQVIPRSAGPIGEINRWAQVLTMTVPLMVYGIVGERGIVRWIAVGGTSLVLGAMVLTFSRGAAVGLVGLGLLAIVTLRVRLRYAVPVVAVLLAVVVSVAPAYLVRIGSVSGVTEEVVSGGEASDTSTLGRITLNIAAAELFVDNPVLGVGPENFKVVSLERVNELGLRHFSVPYPTHNLYLQIAAETGLLGLAAFGSIFAYLLLRLWRLRRQALHNGAVRDARLATAFFFSVAAYLITAIFLHMAYERFLWLFVGLAAAAIAVLQQPVVNWHQPDLGGGERPVQPL
jgi:putative inorganic carbon (HCO3(-)) transporter